MTIARQTPVDQLTWACVDVETTGLKPSEGHRICEIAVVRGPRDEVTAEWSTLVNPERPLDPQAAAVNRLTSAELRSAPRFAQVAAQVLGLLDGAVVVAHNAEFDLGFLEAELSRGECAPMRSPVVDTMLLARARFAFAAHSLGALVNSLGLRRTARHRALGDAMATRAVLLALLARLPAGLVATLGDLIVAQSPSYEAALANAAFGPLLEQALREGGQLRMVYEGRQGQSERVVTPLRIVERRAWPQLKAFCHTRQSERTFRLDRIVSLEQEA